MTDIGFDKLNWLGLGLAIVFNMILGFLWYSPKTPTGRVWMRAMGMDPDNLQKPATGEMMKGLILMIVGAFLMFFVYAHNFYVYQDAARNAATGGDVGYKLNLMDGVMGGVFTWLGFLVPGYLSGVAWERKPWSLFFVNAGYGFVTLVVAGILLVTVGHSG